MYREMFFFLFEVKCFEQKHQTCYFLVTLTALTLAVGYRHCHRNWCSWGEGGGWLMEYGSDISYII